MYLIVLVVIEEIPGAYEQAFEYLSDRVEVAGRRHLAKWVESLDQSVFDYL
jgi:hypothetical protein